MPNKSYFDFTQDILYQGAPAAFKKYVTPEFRQYNDNLANFVVQTRTSLDAEKKEREDRNLNYNSILALAKTAGESDTYASNLFNRINDLSTISDFKQGTEALDGLDKELKDLQERATTKQYGGVDYLADFAAGSYELFRDFKKNLSNETSDYFSKTDLESYLRKDKLDYDSLKSYSTPDDILKHVNTFLGNKRYQVENIGGPSEEDYLKFYNKAQKAPKETAYKDMLLAQLDVKFKTPGSNYYRDPASITDPRTTGDIYVNNFQKTILNAVKETNVKDNLFNEATFLQYDLEKEGIGRAKYKLEQGRNRLIALAEEEEAKNFTGIKPKQNPLYKQKIDEYTDAINGYTAREKELDSIYGVKVGDRSGTWNSAYHRGKESILNLVQFFMGEGTQSGTRDARRALAVNAGYQPEVIDYDKYGNPVLSSQVFYETKAGTKKNWGGFTESGFGMAAEMVPTLLLTRGLTGMLEKTAGAEALAVAQGAQKTTGWATTTLESLNKLDKLAVLPKNVPLVGGPLKLGSRVMTMASVYPTVYERIRQEELKWGGDADSRSKWMAFNEAATEGFGFPEFGGLKVTGYTRSLGAAARTASDIPLTRTQRYLNFMRGGADFAKTTLKINFLESMEEEMALFGEYLIAKGYEDEYKKTGRQQTTLDGAAMMDTFVESFKSGLIYSGFNAGMRHYQITRPDALRDYARYEAAQNPELFKAKLMADFKKNPGSMTEKDLQNAIIEVDNLGNLFKSLSSLDNLKDLNTFLDDEDSRFKLFTKADYRNTLVNIDFESLTEEQREELSKYKLMSKISEEGQKKLDVLKPRIAQLNQKVEAEGLTPEEQKEYTEGQVEYMFLSTLSRYKELNKRDLTNEQIKYLTENNIIQDKDFQYTKEDLDKMMSDVNTDILKTEKRSFKYASMSEAEKRTKIKEAFDLKLDLIQRMEEPSDVYQSYSAIKKDYEYLEKNVNNVHPEVLENKKRLMDAYATRFEQLTTPTENGRTAFENKIAEINLEDYVDNNDLFSLSELKEQLDKNQDFIDEGQSAVIREAMDLASSSIIEKLSLLEGEQKLKALLPIFDKYVKQNVKYFYEPSLFKQLFVKEDLQLDITDQEYEQLRNDLMEMRGKRRSQSLAETGRYDNVDTPVSTEEETVPGSDNLAAIASQARNASTEADESGKSEKRLREDEYTSLINEGRTPAEVVSVVKELVFKYFNRQSANATNITAAINDYIATRDRAQFDAAMRNIEANIETEIRNAKLTNPKSKRAEDLEAALDNIAMWKRTLIKLAQKPSNVLVAPVTPITPGNEEPPAGLNPLAPIIESEEVEIKGDEKAILESLDSAQLSRRMRIIELMSSLRTAALEVQGKDNVRNTEPAVVRRVKHLESLATEPVVNTKIMNRRQFMRETLATLYPEKPLAEIEEDLKVINALFAESDLTVGEWDAMTAEQKDTFLEPLNALVGKNFFDAYAVRSFIEYKGKGLITDPAVIVTIAGENGKLSLMDGFPSEFNFVRETTPEDRKGDKVFPTIPWRISERVNKAKGELAISEQEVKEQHLNGFKNRQVLVKYLQQKDESISVPAEITEGVLLGSGGSVVIAESPISTTSKLEDFMLAENASTAIFGKNFKFSLGRLYYNNNGNPVILSNENISEEDAKTLAKIVFSNDPSIITPAELKDYLYSIVNQIDKDNKLVFYEGDQVQYNKDGNIINEYTRLVNPVLVVKGQKPKKLTEEQFIQELMSRFYKIDRKYLMEGEREGEKLIRFKEVGQEDGTYKLVKSKESYLDYIKRTHSLPVTPEGGINSLVNKSLYLNQESIDKSIKSKKLIPDQPNPIVPPPAAPAGSATTDSKLDIERRRQKNLEDTGDMFDYVSKQARTDGKFNAFYITTKETAIFDTYEEAIDWVNAKYDAELAALGQPVVPTTQTLTPKITDELSIVPFDQIANVMGRSVAMPEQSYVAALAAFKANPENLLDITVMNTNNQPSEYEAGVFVPNTAYYVFMIKAGERAIPLVVVKNTNAPSLGIIQVIGKGENAKFNLSTVESPKPKSKMSLEELSNAVNETSQNPFDSSQVKEAKETRENCKPGSGRLDFAKNKSKGGPGIVPKR